jgi:hypothetical protein
LREENEKADRAQFRISFDPVTHWSFRQFVAFWKRSRQSPLNFLVIVTTFLVVELAKIVAFLVLLKTLVQITIGTRITEMFTAKKIMNIMCGFLVNCLPTVVASVAADLQKRRG